MLLNHKDVVIFDLDGTLLDTSRGIIEAVRFVLHEYGVPVPDENTLLRFIGPPIQQSFHKYIGLDEKKSQEAGELFRDYYMNHTLFYATPYPGIMDLLKELKTMGVRIGVATYKREDYAVKLLDYFHIAQYCDVIYGSNNTDRQTKTAIINACMDFFAVSCDRMIMVGDTSHDAIGAQQAGIDFLAVVYGFGFRSEDDVFDSSNIGCATTAEEIYERIKK